MYVTRSVPTILAAAASLSLALALAGSAPAAVPGQNGRLAFVGNQDGDDEIYAVSPDGSGLTQLTRNAATDSAPAWSPDGRSIAFTSTRDGNFEIYVMRADGSNPRRLTTDPGADYAPTWSPDGRKIAFASDRDGNFEIYVIAADGSHPTRLTNNAADDEAPAWSPDGQRIAFVSDRAPYGPDYEIYVMSVDGSNPAPLTSNTAWDTEPAWSPDGQRIAFTSGNASDLDIYVVGADGSGQTPLTTNHGANHAPSWSPDGRKIAFDGTRADGQKVRIVNADGTGETRVTGAPPTAGEAAPDWQTAPIVASAPGPSDSPPLSHIALRSPIVVARSWRTISGTATDDRAVARVQLSIVRRLRIDSRLRCRALTARGRWQTYRPFGRVCKPRFLLPTRGTATWSARLERRLPTGTYTVTSRAMDSTGQRETRFATELGNQRTVRER
jgi:TolB protein